MSESVTIVLRRRRWGGRPIGFAALLVVALSCGLMPSARAGQWPLSPGDGGLLNLLLNTAVNANGDLDLQVIPQGDYQVLSGTVGGQPLDPPIKLYWGDDVWLKKSKSAGAATWRTLNGYNIGIVLHEKLTLEQVTEYLVHEAYHGFLGCYFPGFAVSKACNKCEHLWVWSKSARAACEAAQDCQKDKVAREMMMAWANDERARCLAANGAAVHPCDGCLQTFPPFDVPTCPDVCTPPVCQ